MLARTRDKLALDMVVMGEARGTPSYVSPVAMQSPRYGGCVSAFFNLFDWTSAKRFSSSKRLRAASKAQRGSFRKSRSFRTDHGKTRMRYEDSAPATRPAGVVARLMGLDTLPAASPVLLQEFMKQEYKPAKPTRSLRERLFTKQAHRQYAARKGRGLAASFRCRSEEWCISPAFVDIPQAQSRFMYAVTQKQQKPFLSRLPPSSTLHGEQIPELSLLQARSSGRNILLQGWPLAGQHNVPRDLYHETEPSTSTSCSSDRQQESIESVGSKPTDSASSRPLLTNAKLVQGRRRGSSWHGSDDSESTIDSHRRTVKSKSAAPVPSPRHRRPKLVSEPEFKHSRHRGSSRSPSDRQSSIIATEISRTSASHAPAGTSQSSTAGSVSSKVPSGNRGPRAGRGPGAKPASNSNAPSQVGKTTTTTKSKEHPGTTERSPAMAPGKPPPGRAKVMHHLPKSDLNKPPKLQRFTEKAAASGVGNRHNQSEERVDDRSKTRNNAQDMASRPVVSNIKRVKHRSVDAVFPELPLDCEPKEITTVQPPDVIRPALFSPDFDFTECSNGEISNSPLIDYDELCDSGERGAISSSSPLLDCDSELREAESISVVSYPVEEIRWEDEIVETILSGRCCERSCSGPSVSSRSVTFSDEERNAADSWSSCVSYNPGDCDSLSDSPAINFPVKELDVEAEVLQCEEPKSPPLKYVQKHIVEEGLVLDEAAEQPSPVSVLQSPFHDETCTSESSPDSKRSEEIVSGNEPERDIAPVTSSSSNIDRIKQALLDLSTFRIYDECTTERAAAREYVKDEQSFIREVLSAASFLSAPGGSSPNWHDRDLVMDPSLFDRLESAGGGALASGGLWRCDRKLLFDCVNEAFAASSLWQWQWQHQWAPELVWRLSRPRGQHLVLTVVKKIHDWRKLASYPAIDALIERDMSAHSGNWRSCIGPEVAEVGVEIESMLWTGILDEVVVDIVSTTHKHSCTNFVELHSADLTPTSSQ